MDTQATGTQPVKVVGVMTAPRYECVWARSTIQHAFQRCGIHITVSGGALYGQSMQNAMQTAVDAGADYIVTVDFDSVITAENVRDLLGWLADRGDIDAIASYQSHRTEPRPLLTLQNRNQPSFHWDKHNPIQVATAHFGLTAIRVSALKEVAKPWFYSKPDANGNWGEGRIDDDIWFWRQWEAAGKTLYVHPGIRIGHMAEVILGFDENLSIIHETQKQWSARNAASLQGGSVW